MYLYRCTNQYIDAGHKFYKLHFTRYTTHNIVYCVRCELWLHFHSDQQQLETLPEAESTPCQYQVK